MTIIIIYVAFYLFALIAENATIENKRRLLVLTCLVLAIIAGTREINSWADTGVYLMSFRDYTPSFASLSSSDEPFGYEEKGFYYLGVLIKSITSNFTAYFLAVSFITFFFLYKAFDKYCYYPFLGICAYVSRFYFARNFIQIRAGLSYAIILLAVQYITNKDWKRYFAIVFIAYLFHHSALIAVPLYFLCMIDIKKWHIIAGLGVAFVIAAFYSNVVRSLVADSASDLNVDTYVDEEYQREWGLSNPMIYFQTFLLIIYTFTEERMKLTTSHYITIRNAYFYSTLILITFSCYTALSGRTSSMFATLEIVIIPSLALTFFKKNRWQAFVIMVVMLSIIFYINYTRNIYN